MRRRRPRRSRGRAPQEVAPGARAEERRGARGGDVGRGDEAVEFFFFEVRERERERSVRDLFFCRLLFTLFRVFAYNPSSCHLLNVHYARVSQLGAMETGTREKKRHRSPQGCKEKENSSSPSSLVEFHALPVPVLHPVRLEACAAVYWGRVFAPQALDALEQRRAATAASSSGGATGGAARVWPRHRKRSVFFFLLLLSLSLSVSTG